MDHIPKHQNSIRLFLAGNIMIGRGVDQILLHHLDPILHEDCVKDAREYVKLAVAKNGPLPENRPVDYIWGEAKKIVKNFDPDLKVGNLETCLTTHANFWEIKGEHYRAHPKNVEVLKSLGLDCAVLANNHILDFDEKGLQETMETLQDAEIIPVGAGLTREDAEEPAIFMHSGQKRVLVYALGHASAGVVPSYKATGTRAGANYLSSLHDRAEIDKLVKKLKGFKKQGELVILSIHWGHNWNFDMEPGQRKFAHRLIDEDAVDLIYGHGSHHIKGLEVYNGKLIIYGAGSFMNDYEGIPNTEKTFSDFRDDLGFMYFPDLDQETGDLVDIHMVPMRLKKFQLSLATEERDLMYLANTMERECKKFDLGLEIGDVGQYFKLVF